MKRKGKVKLEERKLNRYRERRRKKMEGSEQEVKILKKLEKK